MTHFNNFTGVVQAEPKVIKQFPTMLYVPIMTTTGQKLHCLVIQHALDFLYRAHAESRIALYGHFNQHHQFVINKYFVSSQVA
ncbi:hypothetical protein [Secundilactobacillus folii]|uniref:Uncharacterized protein n=1 Tax=Secundilactobacillus folii TaxID=2678357 RepID=A0A7X3C104_9LACO|nr:hypothetical protein [Secundilactobacillus folii]MTV81225.1 hypothetical protein [Secundilactobacillus folii]